MKLSAFEICGLWCRNDSSCIGQPRKRPDSSFAAPPVKVEPCKLGCNPSLLSIASSRSHSLSSGQIHKARGRLRQKLTTSSKLADIDTTPGKSVGQVMSLRAGDSPHKRVAGTCGVPGTILAKLTDRFLRGWLDPCRSWTPTSSCQAARAHARCFA